MNKLIIKENCITKMYLSKNVRKINEIQIFFCQKQLRAEYYLTERNYSLTGGCVVIVTLLSNIG